MGQLMNKVALILGADTRDNMGQLIARRFAQEGAKVVVAGRNVEELNRISDELKGTLVVCDITHRNELQGMVRHAKEWGGRLDIAVNAVGMGLTKPFLENTEDDLEKMLELQFKGPFMFLQAAVEGMTDGGSIIQISSATTKALIENYAAYIGTKAGIDHVVQCVANEFGYKGIRANSISPGLTETPMTAAALATPGVRECFESRYPLGRIGTKDDIASAAVWLASDECFMTGENLQINGGLLLRSNPLTSDVSASVERAMAKSKD